MAHLKHISRIAILLAFSLLSFGSLQADSGHSDCVDPESYKPGEEMMHHVLDTHDWHLFDIPSGTDADGKHCYTPVAWHLPWIVYSAEHGLEFYGNTEKLEASGKYEVHHDKVSLAGGHKHHDDHDDHGEETGHDDHADHAHAAPVYDFSPTRTVVQMIIVLTVLTFVFLAVARGYKKNEGHAPKGIQSFFEPIVTFVRDDIAKVYLKHKAVAYTPYLLTLFFFIWFSNILGITPFNSNIMGNITVTMTLALFSFILINVNGTKDYWKHIVAMPGVPVALLPLVSIIEIFGLFVKPIALMIRLFANITAGHFMILALISMIFIMGDAGKSLIGAVGISPISVLLTIGIFCLEVIVGIVQAYVFTLLTAVFMGQALESHDDHH